MPHIGAGTNEGILALRASRTSAPLPTMSRTRDAAASSDQHTIGRSSARSAGRSRRLLTPGWRRYATSSIDLTTLAAGTARRTSTPHMRRSVRTANETVPSRLSANSRAAPTSGRQGSA